MSTRLHPGRLIAAVSGFIVTTAFAAALADPWPKTVPLPIACYVTQDEFLARNEAAMASLGAETATQEGINQAIDRQIGESNSSDPMQMAARMQEMMMKDPQAAMKYMETMGATEDPAVAQAKVATRLEADQRMKAEEKKLLNDYQAAVDKAYAPARAKFQALRKKLGITEGWGVGETGQPDWAYAEYDAIKREADQGYEAMCAQWFGASGAIRAYLKRYKDYLVQERIPADEVGDTQRLTQYQMLSIPADAFRSTVKHKAVKDYMELADRLYRARIWEAYCRGPKCRDVAGI